MALNSATLAASLKAKTKTKLRAALGIDIQDSDAVDAYYLGIAEAIVEHLTANAEIQPGTMVVGELAVTGSGTLS